MPFPPAAVNQKAKKGLCENGKGIVLPFSKTQPVFCFLCAAGLRRLPCGKKWAFVSFGLQKKEISALALAPYVYLLSSKLNLNLFLVSQSSLTC